MAENREISAEIPSNYSEPGKQLTVSSPTSISLIVRKRIIQLKSGQSDIEADEILSGAIRGRGSDEHWWKIGLGAAVVILFLYILYAGWQWQAKSAAVTEQLLDPGENIDAARVQIAVSSQSMQGQGMVYMVIIICLVIGGIVLFGWTRSTESVRDQQLVARVGMRDIVAQKQKETSGWIGVATDYKTLMETHEQYGRSRDENVRELMSLNRYKEAKLEELQEKKGKLEGEVGATRVALQKTEEMVQHQTEEVKHLRTDLEGVKEEKQDLQVKFHHHKFDPAYPGICFLGDPWQETVTSEGKVISWDNDIGIRFTIPPGAVPESEKLHLTVRPCLNGPFVLPQDHDLASPMYLIQPACDFNEEVELSMSHFADIKSDDDLQSMTFVSAHSKPGRGTCRSGPEYRLRVFQNGVFHVGQSTGIISLKHFCQLAVARKRRSPDAIPESERSTTKRAKGESLYSVRLYRNSPLSEPCSLAVFCVGVCHPVNFLNLTESLNELYPGVKFWPSVIQPVHLSNSAVILVIPTDMAGWGYISDRQLVISKDELDLLLHSPDICSYPPRVEVIFIPPNIESNEKAHCTLKVNGILEEVLFQLLLASSQKQPQIISSSQSSFPEPQDSGNQTSPSESPPRSPWSPERGPLKSPRDSPLRSQESGETRTIPTSCLKGVVNENTPEARALQQCWVQLTQGIQDPEIVADHLFAMKFISQATLQEVGNATLSMPKKNRKLLQNMYRHITFNPNKFWDFVEILKKEEYSVYLASALEIAYRQEHQHGESPQ